MKIAKLHGPLKKVATLTTTLIEQRGEGQRPGGVVRDNLGELRYGE
jgi:hypothetical protein